MDGVTWDKKTPPIAVIDIKRVQHGVWQLAGDINVTSEDEGAETSCEGDLQLEESDGGRDGNSLARLANVSRLLGSDNNPKPVQNKVSGLVVADVKLKGASVSTVESDNSDHKKKWKCGDKTARRMAARIACKFRSAVVIELKKGEIVLKRGANAAITSHPIEPSRSSAQLDHFVAYYALLDCDDFGNAPIPGDEYSTLGINPIYCPPAAAEP
jgi:hypothetical protein